MATPPKLTRIELQIMDALWTKGALSIREIQEFFPEVARPAYTTVQTVVYRLENKRAVRRSIKVVNAHIFEPLISRNQTQRRLMDELLGLSGGDAQPLMSYLIQSGKLSMQDIHDAERLMRELAQKRKQK